MTFLAGTFSKKDFGKSSFNEVLDEKAKVKVMKLKKLMRYIYFHFAIDKIFRK